MLSRIHKRFGSRLRRLVVQLTGKRALAFANLLFPAMPSQNNNTARAKKTLTRAKKDKTKLQNASESDGRVINKNGNRAIRLMPGTVLSNVRLMPGTVSSMSDQHLINVKISMWEEINVMINKNDSYADITSKIQLRARGLGMSMPSNWELLARVQSVCMFKNLADCRDFLIVPHGGYTNYQHRTLLEPHLQPGARKPRLLNDKGCKKKPSAAYNCELPTI